MRRPRCWARKGMRKVDVRPQMTARDRMAAMKVGVKEERRRKDVITEPKERTVRYRREREREGRKAGWVV